MIQNIFIPENIGNYYLFKQKIVGLQISSNYIYATVILAYKEQRIIENCIQEAVSKNNNETDEEAICNTIKSLFLKIGHVDAIYTSISSSLLIFKELTLPFVSLKKIKLVMPFEIESALPFSLDNGVLDCIITKESHDIQNSSNILITATKKEYIEKYLMNFSCAQVKIDKISVDILDLYELYKKVNYLQINLNNFETEIFIYFGVDAVKLVITLEKQLKHVRNLNNSLDLNDVLSQINFTVDSYLKDYPENSRKKVIISGDQKIVQESVELISQTLHAEVEVFHAKKILSLDYIKNSTNSISDDFLISLSTALSQDENSINLKSSIDKDLDHTLINQIKWCIYLTMALLILLFGNYSLKSFRFQRKYNRIQSESMKKIKSAFGLSNKNKTLKNCNKEALDKLNTAKKKWLPLSAKNKGSYLQYLYELSRNINKKEVGLDLNALTIDQDEIILNGKVKDITAVKKLEQQLKCELFTLEDPIQIPEFNSKPIRLTINKNENWL